MNSFLALLISFFRDVFGGAVAEAAVDAEVQAVNQVISELDRWDPIFHKYSARSGIPWRWLKAICWVESDLGREKSVISGMANPGSSSGWSSDGKSRGLMQLTLQTANRERVRPGTTLSDLDDPEISVDLASRYLKELAISYFAWRREAVVRGYNGGPGWSTAGDKSFAMTANYYSRFQTKLEAVMQRHPGDEMEKG